MHNRYITVNTYYKVRNSYGICKYYQTKALQSYLHEGVSCQKEARKGDKMTFKWNSDKALQLFVLILGIGGLFVIYIAW